MVDAGAISEDDLADFVDALEARDRDAALTVARRTMSRGVPLSLVITGLFGPAQREVGRRWMVGAWNVSHEHAATAIVEQVLHAITAPQESPQGQRGRVALVCPEGEFHSLPAQMTAAYLGAAGWEAEFLGVSVSNSALVSHLSDARPLALLVSCSISTNLRGAMEAFGVAHGVGIPALAGGSGFGADEAHALALGADAWASSLADADAVLQRWAAAPPVLNRPHVALYGDHVELRVRRQEILDQVMLALEAVQPGLLDGSPAARAHARDDAGMLLDYLAISLLVDDPVVFRSFVEWRHSLAPVNDAAPAILTPSLRALYNAIPASLSAARAQLEPIAAGRS